jgi:hypothetical protein
MHLTVRDPGHLGPVLEDRLAEWLIDADPADRLDQVLVGQAKGRIDNSGDSEITYKGLWADTAHTRSGKPHYRVGGKPLIDTRTTIYDRLNGDFAVFTDALEFFLRGTLHALFHNDGFTTKGPNFIPFTLRARRIHRKGQDPALEGLEEGEDYIMAWAGVTVPARPIFRFAPEDREEIVFSVRLAVRRGLAGST